jgi:hypothetical protein
LDPLHVHVHGQLPVTDDAVPTEQRFEVGFVLTVVPFALPQIPSQIGGKVAVICTLVSVHMLSEGA